MLCLRLLDEMANTLDQKTLWIVMILAEGSIPIFCVPETLVSDRGTYFCHFDEGYLQSTKGLT